MPVDKIIPYILSTAKHKKSLWISKSLREYYFFTFFGGGVLD